jgi:hypothetical protein
MERDQASPQPARSESQKMEELEVLVYWSNRLWPHRFLPRVWLFCRRPDEQSLTGDLPLTLTIPSMPIWTDMTKGVILPQPWSACWDIWEFALMAKQLYLMSLDGCNSPIKNHLYDKFTDLCGIRLPPLRCMCSLINYNPHKLLTTPLRRSAVADITKWRRRGPE